MIFFFLSKEMDENFSAFLCYHQVRKEKLGDRITALQQLVSPFGKVIIWIFSNKQNYHHFY